MLNKTKLFPKEVWVGICQMFYYVFIVLTILKNIETNYSNTYGNLKFKF